MIYDMYICVNLSLTNGLDVWKNDIKKLLINKLQDIIVMKETYTERNLS